MKRQRLINGLNQGIELTKVLEAHVDFSSPLEFQRLLLRSLLSNLLTAVSIATALPAEETAGRPVLGEYHGGEALAMALKKRYSMHSKISMITVLQISTARELVFNVEGWRCNYG